MANSLLLKNAVLLCENDTWESVENGVIGIRDDRIVYVGNRIPEEKFDQTLDLSGHLVLPGLFNLHAHTGMTSLRGIGSGLPLHKWLYEAMFPIENKFNDNDLIVNGGIAIMEMIASGVVSFSDMYRSPWLMAKQVAECGMKANLCSPLMSKDFSKPELDQVRIQLADDFFRDYHNHANGRIRADYAIHAEYTSLPESVRTYSEHCLRSGARMHLHLSETAKEHNECIQRHGKTPAQFFKDLGTFENPVNAAHCVMISDEDIQILREKAVTVIHNPSSNMKLGSGFMPIRKLLNAGVRVTLGTDSTASNNNLNFFEEMHLASLIHCGAAKDPTVLSAEDVLTMATSAGAAAQGREDSGRIRTGFKADLAVIDLNKPHLQPQQNYPALVVYAAQAADVVYTIINGQIVYDHGNYLTLDAEKTIHDYISACKRIY